MFNSFSPVSQHPFLHPIHFSHPSYIRYISSTLSYVRYISIVYLKQSSCVSSEPHIFGHILGSVHLTPAVLTYVRSSLCGYSLKIFAQDSAISKSSGTIGIVKKSVSISLVSKLSQPNLFQLDLFNHVIHLDINMFVTSKMSCWTSFKSFYRPVVILRNNRCGLLHLEIVQNVLQSSEHHRSLC